MGSIKCEIGKLVEPISIKCGIPKCEWVSGVNIYKRFMPSRNIGSDTSNYLVVPQGGFAVNLMHVGRDGKIPVAMNNTDSTVVVSSAYFVFRVTDESIMLKEYLYILMTSPEFDRYAAFCTDSSIRDGLDWSRFCEFEVNLPPLAVQQKFVDVYNAMLVNQRIYESGLADLKLTCDIAFEVYKHTADRVAIGTLLKEIDIRNRSVKITKVQGININKEFMASVANLSTADLSKYKIIKKNQFAYSAMQTGRDECIRFALLSEDEPVMISPAYSVLEINDEFKNVVLAEYIMLWFSRSESDRYGSFISDSSIRASLELSRFYEISIPLPSIIEQQAIANLYNAYMVRREMNDMLKRQLNSICPILIKGSLEEAIA